MCILECLYDRVDRNKIIEEGKNKKVFMYCVIIMMIITIIYLWWSFVTNAWSVSWIVYPIGGIVCGIVWLIFEGKEE